MGNVVAQPDDRAERPDVALPDEQPAASRPLEEPGVPARQRLGRLVAEPQLLAALAS
jgi:hypothetical protein